MLQLLNAETQKRKEIFFREGKSSQSFALFSVPFAFSKYKTLRFCVSAFD